MDGGGEREIKYNVMLIEGCSGFLWWLYRGGEVTGHRNYTSHGKSEPGTKVLLNWVRTGQKKLVLGYQSIHQLPNSLWTEGHFC